MYPEEYMFEGVYKGPETFEGDFVLPNGSEIKSVKGLRKVIGTLNVDKCVIDNLDTLVEVKGTAHMAHTNITKLPNLEIAKEGLDISGCHICEIPNITTVDSMLIGETQGIPYMPRLGRKIHCIINTMDHTKGSWKTWDYSSVLYDVFDVPITDLVNLRAARPELAHLIDARLKGKL